MFIRTCSKQRLICCNCSVCVRVRVCVSVFVIPFIDPHTQQQINNSLLPPSAHPTFASFYTQLHLPHVSLAVSPLPPSPALALLVAFNPPRNSRLAYSMFIHAHDLFIHMHNLSDALGLTHTYTHTHAHTLPPILTRTHSRFIVKICFQKKHKLMFIYLFLARLAAASSLSYSPFLLLFPSFSPPPLTSSYSFIHNTLAECGGKGGILIAQFGSSLYETPRLHFCGRH